MLPVLGFRQAPHTNGLGHLAVVITDGVPSQSATRDRAVDRIQVLKPIRFETLRRNELGHKIPQTKVLAAMKKSSTAQAGTHMEDDRQQRASILLRDVAYVVEAYFVLTDGRSVSPLVGGRGL